MDDFRTLEVATVTTLLMLILAAAVHWLLIWADHGRDDVISAAENTED